MLFTSSLSCNILAALIASIIIGNVARTLSWMFKEVQSARFSSYSYEAVKLVRWKKPRLIYYINSTGRSSAKYILQWFQLQQGATLPLLSTRKASLDLSLPSWIENWWAEGGVGWIVNARGERVFFVPLLL